MAVMLHPDKLVSWSELALAKWARLSFTQSSLHKNKYRWSQVSIHRPVTTEVPVASSFLLEDFCTRPSLAVSSQMWRKERKEASRAARAGLDHDAQGSLHFQGSLSSVRCLHLCFHCNSNLLNISLFIKVKSFFCSI